LIAVGGCTFALFAALGGVAVGAFAVGGVALGGALVAALPWVCPLRDAKPSRRRNDPDH
jgi:hypothetical protein